MQWPTTVGRRGAVPLLVRRKMNGCSLFGCSARSNRLCENGCPDFSLLLLLSADECCKSCGCPRPSVIRCAGAIFQGRITSRSPILAALGKACFSHLRMALCTSFRLQQSLQCLRLQSHWRFC